MTAETAHAEVMEAARTAMEAFHESRTVRGFPGVVPPTKKKTKRKNGAKADQVSLWRDGECEKKTKAKGKEPELTMIHAALRLPTRPCPTLERAQRTPLAHREVVLVGEASFVVRIQVGESNVYSHFRDGRRSHGDDAAATIIAACPEAQGTVWQGCILASPDGPATGDELFLERWIAEQQKREAAWACVDPQAWRKRA